LTESLSEYAENVPCIGRAAPSSPSIRITRTTRNPAQYRKSDYGPAVSNADACSKAEEPCADGRSQPHHREVLNFQPGVPVARWNRKIHRPRKLLFVSEVPFGIGEQ
jgi:hypothetical protein